MSQNRPQSHPNIFQFWFNHHSQILLITNKRQFRGRRFFATHCVTELSQYVPHTTVTSISNYYSPFKEREINGKPPQMLWQKTSATNSAIKLFIQYIPRYPFQTLNNIFIRCFHFHQRHIPTTFTHLTLSKLPKPTALLKSNSIDYPEQQSRPNPIPTGTLTPNHIPNTCTPHQLTLPN